ncbi:MAG: YdcF family protein [Myxococcaceae bacterium]|nr:YdcF family protein [Myxococcaceae bacterium]MCI0672335.1 YdcF family protein [Myxococcaceae bacterium]
MARRRTPPRRPPLRRAVRVLVWGLLAFLAASFYVEVRYLHRIRSRALAPRAPVALVFGAGLSAQGVPSPVLAERLDAAVALYREGKVGKLLLSGDNADRYHDETAAMRNYALEQGVRVQDLLVDRAGLSTYDSVVRAQQVYGVNRALLVTQRFHLSRALFIANALGMDAWGVAADGLGAGSPTASLRELLSRPMALAFVLARPHAAEPSPQAAKARSAPGVSAPHPSNDPGRSTAPPQSASP